MSKYPQIEDIVLTICAKPDFDATDRDRVLTACDRAKIDWDLILSAALSHKVAPLVYLRLEKCGGLIQKIPRYIDDLFQFHITTAMARNAHMHSVTVSIADFFSRLDHDVIIIKGTAMALRFGERYSHVMANDVDLAVKPRGARQPIPAFTYRKIVEIENQFYEETDKHGIKKCIEIDAWCPHDIAGTCYGSFSSRFGEVWDRATKEDMEGIPVMIPSFIDMLIISSINFVRKRHLRLRSLFDIGLLLECSDELDWDTIIARARSYYCSGFLYAAILTALRLLECKVDQKVLDKFKVGCLKKRVFQAIVPSISPCRSYLSVVLARSHYAVPPLDRQAVASRPTTEILSLRVYWLTLVIFRTLCYNMPRLLYWNMTYPAECFIFAIRRSRIARPIRRIRSYFRGEGPLV